MEPRLRCDRSGHQHDGSGSEQQSLRAEGNVVPAAGPANGAGQAGDERGSWLSAPVAAAASTVDAQAQRVRVVTDVLDIDLSLQGGTLDRADLVKYPQSKTKDSPPVRLLTTADANYQVLRSGLRTTSGGAEPAHLAASLPPRRSTGLRPERRSCACRSPGPTDRG